jgi:hypothetical protein
MTRNEKADVFWKRVDDLKKDITMKAIVERAGLEYEVIRVQRTRNRIPRTTEAVALAGALGTTVEYLITGKTNQSAIVDTPRVYTIFAKIRQADETTLQLVERVLQIETPAPAEKSGA